MLLGFLLVFPKSGFAKNPLLLAQAQPPSSQTPPPPAEKPPEQPPGEAEASKAEEEEEAPTRIPLAGVQQGGVLLQPDQLVLEPTLGYSFSTGTRLILTGFSVLPLIVLGTFESEKATTQSFSPSFGFRYGIKRGIQFDFRIPLLYLSVTRLRLLSDETGQRETTGESSGIGDISFGLSYQFLYERAWIPDMVFRLGGSAPTGRSQFDIFDDIAGRGVETIDQFQEQLTQQGSALGSGRWSVDATLTAVKALDPAILFGTVGFSYSPPVTETLLTLQAQPTDPPTIIVTQVQADLGGVSSISASLGMAISLNNQLSMNWSFSNVYRFSQTANGQSVPDSQLQITNFNMGFNIAVTPRITTNIQGSIGITPDAPDFAIAMTVPVSFTNALASTVTWLKEHRPFKSKPPPVVPEAAPEAPEAPAAPGAPTPPAQKEPSKGEPSPGEPIKQGNNNGPPSTKEPQK